MATSASASISQAKKNLFTTYNQVDQARKARFKQKLELLQQNEEPYLLACDCWSMDRALWAAVKFPDRHLCVLN